MKGTVSLVFAVFIQFAATPPCSTAFQPDTGSPWDAIPWVSLFNGRDLTGWSVHCVRADREKQYWSVDNGAILCNSLEDGDHDYVWLISDSEYDDFILSLEFQGYRDSPGNSGIQIRSRYDTAAEWLDGPQIDVHPAGPWRTGFIFDETREARTWIYPAVLPVRDGTQAMANPFTRFYYHDEGNGWNSLLITAIGMQIRADLNGIPVTSYGGEGKLNDADHQQHSVGRTGHIALQLHTKDKLKIRYRNIRIKTLHHTAR